MATKAKPKKNKKKWIQKAAKSMKKRGTEGSFTAWCKAHGFKGVSAECIAAAKKASPAIRKKAAFAKAVGAGKK